MLLPATSEVVLPNSVAAMTKKASTKHLGPVVHYSIRRTEMIHAEVKLKVIDRC
jgi:hypothetical protein